MPYLDEMKMTLWKKLGDLDGIGEGEGLEENLDTRLQTQKAENGLTPAQPDTTLPLSNRVSMMKRLCFRAVEWSVFCSRHLDPKQISSLLVTSSRWT